MAMAKILAYSQIRDHEEFEEEKAKIEAMLGSKMKGVM